MALGAVVKCKSSRIIVLLNYSIFVDKAQGGGACRPGDEGGESASAA